MSNQFQSITSGLAELKNIYEGPIQDQFNEDVTMFRGAEKVKKGWSGYQVVRPLRVRRNQGIGATSDGGNLPAIGIQTTTQATIQAKFNYLRFGITGPMIKSSQNDQGSFVRSAAYELEQGYNDLKNDMNRQVGWNGDGTLAQANAATVASATLVIKGRESSEPALKFVDVGLVFDIVSSSTVIQSAITVLAISGNPEDATATLTLNAPVTCSASDAIVRSGSYGYELQGVLYSMDGATSSIYGVNRATYPVYQGNSLSLSSAALTLDKMQQSWNAGKRRGGAKYSAIKCDYDSLRFYQRLLTVDKRYSNTIKGDGGFSDKDQNYLEFNGLPLVADKDFAQRILFLTENDWKLYVLCDLEFADETGTMYIAQTGTDQLEVRIRYFANLFNEQPNANAIMKSYVSP